MVGSFVRLAAAAAFCIALAGCASGPSYSNRDDDAGASREIPLQCVPYARERSGVALYGDAYTWWDKAAGRFARSSEPSQGSVMVLTNYAGPNRSHVAVVRQVVDGRTIKVDHANWLNDGAIFTDDPVRDVSYANDWSEVKVFNPRTGAWGTRVYPIQEFIGPGPDTGETSPMVAGYPGSRDDISALIAQEAEDGAGE